MGDLERRVEKLEGKVGVSPVEPRFIVHTLVERNEEGVVMERHPTPEALEKAQKEAIEKNPGRNIYILYYFEDYYYEPFSPQQHGD